MSNTIKVKRGTNLSNAGTPAAGELIYKTDTNTLYVGDGSTAATSLTGLGIGDIQGVTAGTGLSGGGTSGTVTLNVDASQTQITAVGTIGTGVWNGTAIASAYLDADTAHLSGTQTFTGAKTFGTQTWGGHIAWNNGININTGGECSFDMSSGDQWGVWDGDFTIKSIYGAQVRIGESGNRGLAVYGPLTSTTLTLPVGEELYFGGGSHTYIGEDVDDRLRFFCGGAEFMRFTEDTANILSLYQNTYLNDDLKLYFGSHSDVYMYYEPTNDEFYIRNVTGDTKIRNEATDADIIFSNDDGSGGNTNYMVIDGGAVSIDLLQDTRLKAAKKLFLDGGGNTYIYEESADNVMFYIGGRNMLRLHEGNGEVVVNDSQVDTNFRVESDTIDDLFFCDAGTSRVGIGTNGPGRQLTLYGEAVIRLDGNSADPGLDFNTSGTSDMQIRYRGSSDKLQVYSYGNSANVMTIQKANGYVGIGTESPNSLLHIADGVLSIGTGHDMEISHSSNQNYIDLDNGNLYFRDDADNNIFAIAREGNGVQLYEGSITLQATGKLRLDGNTSGDTYIYEQSGNKCSFVVGNEWQLVIDTSSNITKFNSQALDQDFQISGDNTAELFYVDASADKVGIGTNSPDTNLDITASGVNGVVINQDAANADISSRLFFKEQNSTVALYNTGNTFSFRTGATINSTSGTERFYVNTSGATSVGNFTTTGNSFFNYGMVVNEGGNDADFRVESQGNTSMLRVDASANRVGVGTGSPSETFHVVGTTILGSTGATKVYIDGAGNGYHQGAIVFRGTDDDASYRGQGVYYHDAASDIEYFSGTLYANDAWAVCRKTSTASHDDSVAQGSNALLMVEGGGDVGIGTSNPAYKLDVHGAGRIYSAAGDADLRMESGASNVTPFMIKNGAGNNRVDFMTGGATAMVINSSQNVGIGLTSPSYKLHTAGTSYFTDQMRIVGATDVGLVVESTDGSSMIALKDNSTGGDYYNGIGADGNELFLKANNNIRVKIASTGTKFSENFGGTDDYVHINPANGGNRTMTITGDNIDVITNGAGSNNLNLQANGGNVVFGGAISGVSTLATSSTITTNYGMSLENGATNFLLYNNTNENVLYMRDTTNGAMIQTWGVNNATIHKGLIINETGGNYDTRIEGDTDANLVRVDADVDRVGIGTATPGNKFTVNSTGAYQASIQYDASTRFRVSVEDSGRTRFYTDNSADIGVESGDFYIQPTKFFYLDGGNDTYLHEVSANEIAFNTGGGERMRLTTGGLGIGIDPAEVLDLKTTSGDCRLRLDAPNGSDTEIKFYNAGAVVYTIGHDDGTGRFVIGTANVDTPKVTFDTSGNVYAAADVIAYASSDKKLKDNIVNIKNPLDKISKLNGIEFDWNNNQDVYDGHDIGVIAQEVEEVLPEIVETRDDGYKAVKYEKIVPLLIEAIKEQQEEIELLKANYDDLKYNRR